MSYTSACWGLFLALVTSPALVADENWGQWRGPLNSGVAESSDPPTTWSETENVRWKVSIDGNGTSTPIVWDDKVFVLTAIRTDEKDASIPDPKDQPKTNFFDVKRPNAVHQFVVTCLDRDSGKEVWRNIATSKIPHEGAHHDNDFASASPTTNGDRLICWFGSAGLFCYDLNGKKLWERDLGEVTVGSSLGEGSSPVLYEDKVVIVRDFNRQGSIEVLNAFTGETIWQQGRDEDNVWATPLVVEHSGRTQVITTASNFVRSYDLESGILIWQCSGLTGNCTPCPQLFGDYVVCMSGYQGYAAMAIPLTETGDISNSPKIKWVLDQGTPYVPSAVLYEGLLYFNQSNQSILRCVDATSGEIIYGPQRINGLSNIYASPVAANGNIYFVGRDGTTVVIKKSRNYEVIATNRLN